MQDFVQLWAQWGILNFEQFEIVKKYFGDLETAWKKIDLAFLLKLGFGHPKSVRLLEIKRAVSFQHLQGFDYQILYIDEPNYPACLKTISSPPVFLFVRGKLPPLHKSIGVVGTRAITDYGKVVTEKFVADLVHNQFVIVSGLALGVDALAHQITLKNAGRTIAVLGSGLDQIYPSQHCWLADRIIKTGGAIVSEYPIGTPALQHHFPFRNRIISGLSRGVLIVEGGVKSGALITARYALEQGREVFAIPNNINKMELSGTNHLIRRAEAKLVEKPAHILEEFNLSPVRVKQPISFTGIESELIETIVNEGKSIDELTAETSYNVAKLSEVLIGLQLKGVVREINRKWVII